MINVSVLFRLICAFTAAKSVESPGEITGFQEGTTGVLSNGQCVSYYSQERVSKFSWAQQLDSVFWFWTPCYWKNSDSDHKIKVLTFTSKGQSFFMAIIYS